MVWRTSTISNTLNIIRTWMYATLSEHFMLLIAAIQFICITFELDNLIFTILFEKSCGILSTVRKERPPTMPFIHFNCQSTFCSLVMYKFCLIWTNIMALLIIIILACFLSSSQPFIPQIRPSSYHYPLPKSRKTLWHE